MAEKALQAFDPGRASLVSKLEVLDHFFYGSINTGFAPGNLGQNLVLLGYLMDTGWPLQVTWASLAKTWVRMASGRTA